MVNLWFSDDAWADFDIRGCYNCVVCYAVLVNGGIAEDGLLPSDQRTGKKGKRRRSSSKLVDGKGQAMSPGKENIDVGSSHIESGLKEQDRFHDPLCADGGKPYTFTRIFLLWY